ncbi:hypothetical protein BC939DRAFT_436368 [Gamsiella multidivaricata]|uniref:uncharacterized protein n=1 Tax=Gamsiella multidivaricata TaxID=101098 RepID=UPI00222033BB|nr:uncharacterized protein BC939DRAFT_436368 [Gamsiella multidivaricata]KAG0365583.1 hypothetical protein BGZ54_006394 [Gamsiella multidivaricata]KAI7831745.1 hypothetical protein BC939DRAFT_436368 [Gamsiella multidivaricata]
MASISMGSADPGSKDQTFRPTDSPTLLSSHFMDDDLNFTPFDVFTDDPYTTLFCTGETDVEPRYAFDVEEESTDVESSCFDFDDVNSLAHYANYLRIKSTPYVACGQQVDRIDNEEMFSSYTHVYSRCASPTPASLVHSPHPPPLPFVTDLDLDSPIEIHGRVFSSLREHIFDIDHGSLMFLGLDSEFDAPYVPHDFEQFDGDIEDFEVDGDGEDELALSEDGSQEEEEEKEDEVGEEDEETTMDMEEDEEDEDDDDDDDDTVVADDEDFFIVPPPSILFSVQDIPSPATTIDEDEF